MARKLPDRGTQFLSRLDRLEGHLNQADHLDQKVKAVLLVPAANRHNTRTTARKL